MGKRKPAKKKSPSVKRQKRVEQLPPPDTSDHSLEDSDSDQWETIDLPTYFNAEMISDQSIYHDVEVVMETPRVVAPKLSKMEMAYQRQLRDWMHNSHVVVLISHFMIRNTWCSRNDVQSVCLSVIPDYIQLQSKQKDKGEDEFTTCVKWLLAWWYDYFDVISHGLMTRSFDEYNLREWDHSLYTDLLEALGTHVKRFDLQDTEIIPDAVAFVQYFAEKKGSRDLSAQLFTALLRTLGFDARLICSLQPMPYRVPAKRKASSNTASTSGSLSVPPTASQVSADENKGDSVVKFPLRATKTTANLPVDTHHKQHNIYQQKKAKPPTVWSEIWDPYVNRWICIDPVRQLYNKPLLMEPGVSDRRNLMSMVLAMESPPLHQQRDQNLCRVIDVTKRYTTHWQRSLSLRERDLTKREKEIGWHRWSDLLMAILNGNKTTREVAEQEELESLRQHEQLPNSLQGFRNHPHFALQRHLTKQQVIYPDDTPIIGHIKGEKIYPRSSIHTVHTRETWIKQGRVVKTDQAPAKQVTVRAVTTEKKRWLEQAKLQGDIPLADCFGRWQTELYQAPPVVNGIVPKNEFGCLDLFTSSMLPPGSVHIDRPGIAKVARYLGIDFAEAVIDFEFSRGHAIPVIKGIVVDEEASDILLEAWCEHEQIRHEKDQAKRERQELRQQHKDELSAIISDHIDNEYGNQGSTSASAWASHRSGAVWDQCLKKHAKCGKTEQIGASNFIQDNRLRTLVNGGASPSCDTELCQGNTDEPASDSEDVGDELVFD
ncbi:Rad4-domain-containing protein [Hesseltinella vesiculosa]|uniref:Rad4-domain-containing protein n=1 Tax=Hesseltinella vesiculosa TaxID=101127 RepID=A0A1X2G6I1_9FUNG|nr:Rad4-domain-containing protein [Hesseltinella vesiculosa]